MKPVSVENIFGGEYGHSEDEKVSPDELAAAFRNKALPLEALRYDVTPTGLHYNLIHFDIPYAAQDEWSLTIEGAVEKPVELSLAALKERETKTATVTMECAGNGRGLLSPRPQSMPWLEGGVSTAQWTGTPLLPVLQNAGLLPSAIDVLFTGTDDGVQGQEVSPYQRSLALSDESLKDALLVWEMNGAPLEPQHGHPLRLIMPGWYGMTSVKWLSRIEILARPFEGYQMNTYRYRQTPDEPGEVVDTIKPRALMIPPGVTDFKSQKRMLRGEAITLHGKAWAGRHAVAQVEFSHDDGKTWRQCELEPAANKHAWQNWSVSFHAKPGHYFLRVRATDDAGRVQPVEQSWTWAGMGNNMAQRVEVFVLDS